MKVENLKVRAIKPYEANAKKHPPEQVEHIANSIREFGWQQPLVVDRNNVLVIGHGRLLAAKKLGLEEVPCVRADELTDEQIKALRLADNKTNESEWDFDLVALDMLDITIDMSQFGFDTDEEIAEKAKKEKVIKEMELKAFEHYDYVVFVFKNQMDWLNVVQNFGLERVNAGYGKTRKIGLGRVVDGKRLLEKLGHQSGNSEQRESEEHNDDEPIA